MLISEWATIGLLIVTGIYASLTFLILGEQRKARRELFKPKLYAKLYYHQPVIPYIKVTNVGKGSALDADIKITTEPKNDEISWHTEFLEPNEYQCFMLKEVTISEIIKKYNKIIVKTNYRDIYEKSKPIFQEIIIDLKKEEENNENVDILGSWVTNDIQEIREELKEIKLELIRMSQGK